MLFLGIVVKCHQSRSLDQNRKMARLNLATKLDVLVNGDDSVEGQIKTIENKKSITRERKRRKLSQLKAEWRQRENKE